MKTDRQVPLPCVQEEMTLGLAVRMKPMVYYLAANLIGLQKTMDIQTSEQLHE